jgi:TonB-dependent starch-binding outer membrane protein SusC
MKKKLIFFRPTLWILILVCFVCNLSISQNNNNNISHSQEVNSIQKQKNVRLSEVLKEIKQKFGIDLLYEEKLVKDVIVENFVINDEENIEQCLDKVLATSTLTFKKIKDKSYLVVKEKNFKQKNAEKPNPIPIENQISEIDISKRNSDVQNFTNSFADILISGIVTDEKGNPLEGVSVLARNINVSTITNKEGKYSIKIKDRNEILKFTFVGFIGLEKGLGTTNTLNIVLKETSHILDDVVVVGYGTVKRKDLTGSVSSVNIADMQKAPVRSFDEALGGRVAGVQVTSDDGQPGSGYNLIIRGSNSITQNNGPLFVIDGFPIENPDNNSINPAEIETLDILKDASSTAIYGARGANGVIVITTKKGKIGLPTINYNVYVGVQRISKKMELLSPYEFVSLQKEINPLATDSIYLKNGKKLEDYKNVDGIDWQSELFRDAIMQNHTFSLSGGTDKTKYVVSGSITNQDGIVVNSGFKRYQGRLSLEQKLSEKLKFTINSNYANSSTYGVIPSQLDGGATQSTFNLMYNLWSYRPITGGNNDALEEALVDPENFNLALDNRLNPLVNAQNEQRKTINENFFVNSSLAYEIFKGLSLKISGGFNRQATTRELFNNSQTRSGYSFIAGINNVNGSISRRLVSDYLNENTITYNKRFNKYHQLNILGGFTIQSNRSEFNGLSATALPIEALGLSGLDQGTALPVQSALSEFSLVSYLGRVNYSFFERYLLTASLRSDASSKFAKGNRVGVFPSAAFAWKLGEESFMKNVKFINDAKVRISYGITGNNRVSDFAYLSTIIYPTTRYSFNNGVFNTATPGAFGNPNLKWESTEQFNIGIDLDIFQNKLKFVADYYNKTTFDLLLDANLPMSSGFGSTFKNVGKVSNSGLEFAISSINIENKNFKWTSSFNISFNKTKILGLNEGQENILSPVNWDNFYKLTPTYIAQIGSPIALLYGYVWNGNYQFEDFDLVGTAYVLKSNVQNNGSPRNSIQPGDIKYKDLNGDGIVNSSDITIIGDPNPAHIGGFSNDFSYKGFNLNLLLQWSYGNDIYNANRLIFEGNPQGSGYGYNQFATYKDRWTPTNPSNTQYRVNGRGPNVNSSRVVEDGSFLRLKTVSFSYDIPAKSLKKLKIKTLRIYTSAQNLITWTKYSGLDPEVSTKSTALTPGFDYSPYPRAYTLTFGAQINF